MITFFRKFRKRLLSQNKFTRYLLYALGEIILVMVGILLAVQVNDWNSDRKLHRTNSMLIEKLIGEVELNIERLATLDTKIQRGDRLTGYLELTLKADTALRFITEGLDTAKVIWLLNSDYFVASSFNLHSTVYEEMKNTGRLYTLGSDSLIHNIDRYYRRIVREELYTSSRNEMGLQRWFECKYGFQDLRVDYQVLGVAAIGNHPWLFDSDSKNFLDLKSAISTSGNMMSRNRVRLLELIEDSENFITKLQAELNNTSTQ